MEGGAEESKVGRAEGRLGEASCSWVGHGKGGLKARRSRAERMWMVGGGDEMLRSGFLFIMVMRPSLVHERRESENASFIVGT